MIYSFDSLRYYEVYLMIVQVLLDVIINRSIELLFLKKN
jgi:hypothetical protein